MNAQHWYGGQSSTATLRRVLVRPPREADCAAWREYGWRAAPDPARAAEEHEAFRVALAESGAEVIVADGTPEPNPDAIYAYDPALVADRGAVVLRPGKDLRRNETGVMERSLVEAGVPIAARLEAPATFEGGDAFWLDRSTLVVGRSYRTNDAGIRAVSETLPDVDVIAFDLPHAGGPSDVFHLMSVISPLDVDLAAVYLPLMPARLVELLRERGVGFVEVSEEEFGSMGCNALALGPRVAIALDGNPETHRRMEAAGVDVRVYRGEEISRKGDGGPTCLTRPLLRA